jgi:hypothetical protein
MKSLIKYILIVVSLIFITCNSQLQKTDINKYTFEVKESLALPLDTVTKGGSLSLQNALIDNKEYLFILFTSGPYPNISIFDMEQRNLDGKIHLSKEGPDEVPNPNGIYVINHDAVFVSARTSQLYLVNNTGKVVDKFSTEFSDQIELPPSIMVTTMNPMFLRNNEIYFCTRLVYPNPIKDQTTIPVSAKLKLDSNKFIPVYYKTEKYQQGQWGMGGMLDRFYHTYNADEDLIIHSYGNDEDIYVYDSLNTKRSYYAGSKEMKPIKPPSKDKVLESGETLRYEAFTGAYEAIKYDPYRKMYYRFAFLPVDDPATQPTVLHGKIAIIILDSNFQKVGEYILPKGYNHLMSFVGKAGLHIASRSKYSQDEDHLTFDIFVPVEN